MLKRQTVQLITPRKPILMLFALAGTVGCSAGGQSTDEFTLCQPEIVTVVASDTEATELGFSVNDLSWAWRSQTVPGYWRDRPEITLNNASSDTVVQLSLARVEGAAAVKDSGEACGGSRLVVPAELHVSTSDGLIDERLPTDLVVTRRDFATAVAPLGDKSLQGSLTVASTAEGVELVQSTFYVTITPLGLSGSLNATLQRRVGDSLQDLPSSDDRLLEWPSDSLCSPPLVQGPLDITSSPWSSLTWTQREWQAIAATPADGTSYDVTIETAAALCEAASTDKSVPARIQLADLHGDSFAIEGAFVNDGTVLRFAPGDWLRTPELARQFDERFRDAELSLKEYDEVSLELSTTLTNEQATGTLHIKGYRDECNVTCDSNKCGGCGPMT